VSTGHAAGNEFVLRILERSVQLIEREGVRAADMNLDLVLVLARRPNTGTTTNSVGSKSFSSVRVIERRVTIVISWSAGQLPRHRRRRLE
jgi:hypothetical protein